MSCGGRVAGGVWWAAVCELRLAVVWLRELRWVLTYGWIPSPFGNWELPCRLALREAVDGVLAISMVYSSTVAMTTPHLLLLLLGFALLSTGFAEHGATQKLKEAERAWNTAFRGKVLNESLPVRWSKDGEMLLFHLETEPGKRVWHEIELASGERREVGKTAEKREAGKGKRAFTERLRLERPDTPEAKSGPRSPNKAFRVEVENGRLWLHFEDEDGKVSREVSGPPPESGFHWQDDIHWSPDSACFVAWKNSTNEIRKVHYVRSSPKDQLQPEHFTKEYSKPGDELNVARPVLFYVDEERSPLVMDHLIGNPYRIDNPRWHGDGERFTFEYIERGFGKFRVIEGHAAKGTKQVLLAEEDEKFVCVFYNCFRHDLDDGKEILWLSERSGFNHLYLLDGRDGSVIRRLTKGTWVVRDVVHVAADKPGERWALLRLSGVYAEQDPYHLHYARVGLDDGSCTLLTDGDGIHERLKFGPDRTHYVATWSRVDHPPVHELRRLPDGKKIATLAAADASALFAAGFPVPERFVTTDRNGEHKIYGIIKRPPDFDPKKSYPVLESIYAGPHNSFVPKAWTTGFGTGSQLSSAGFIVVYIDGLGTRNRGKAFHQVAYKNLMDSGFPDRVKWIRAAAATRPEMDLERVGLYGGSAGGQSTLAGLLTQPSFYKAGAADCGCHDNRMDKIWWNEQWMDWPVDESYKNNSNLTHIDKLQGKLLLTVGEVDTNVDPSSTLQIVNGLIKADKDFEFYLVPNGGHGVGGSPYLRRVRTEFFQRHLGRPR